METFLQKMVCKLVLALIVSVLLATQPSTSSPIENEKLAALSERFDQLQTKVESLVMENEALKIRVDYLERKDTENEAKIREQGEEIIQLKTKMAAKLESIQSAEPYSHDELVAEIRSSKDNTMGSPYRQEDPSNDSSTRAVVPSSCRDLALIGHNLDGLYLVQNVDTKRVETVYCDFGTTISQDLIGHVDVKTKTVNFYVQKDSNFGTVDAVIPFEVERLNEGAAFNLSAGIFTVPVSGIYHFDFSATKSPTTTYLWVYLKVNGVTIGDAYTSQTSNGVIGENHTVSLSASLRLVAGDRVNLSNQNGVLDDANLSAHFTHFTGWLVEEDLM